jgi:Tfp pilus assembly protein PilV
VRSIDPDKRSLRSRLRADGGSVLVEVMVGAVVLSIATAALLNGIDGAQGTGTQNKARSTAAALAEQDQERLRALPVATLAAPPYYGTSTPPPVTVAGVSYTVRSTVGWSTDTGGPISCSNTSKTAANLRILSEVTSPATKGTIDLVSLVTPPPGTFGQNQGRAIVKVAKEDGTPVPNVLVTLSGAASLSGTTNSLGCVVFQFAPTGNYTATVTGGAPPLVDYEGNSAPSQLFTVNQSQSTLTSFVMDTRARIQTQFDTSVNGNAVTTNVASRWLTVTSPNLAAGFETFEANPAGTPNTMIETGDLFPFSSGYGAYAGKCLANDPSRAPTNNLSYLKTYTPTANQILTTGSNRTRMPSINVRVVTNNNLTSPGPTGTPNATIFVYPVDSACTGMVPPPTFPTQVSGSKTYGSTTYAGVIPNPGYPYGSYKICAQVPVGAGTRHGHADVRGTGFDTGILNHPNDTVLNTDPDGNNPAWNQAAGSTYPASIRIWINTSTTAGQFPTAAVGGCHQ